jgi:hypothetical protein
LVVAFAVAVALGWWLVVAGCSLSVDLAGIPPAQPRTHPKFQSLRSSHPSLSCLSSPLDRFLRCASSTPKSRATPPAFFPLSTVPYRGDCFLSQDTFHPRHAHVSPPRYSFLALFTHSLPAFLVTSLALIRWLSFASIVTVRIATSFCVDFQHSVHLSPRGFEKALRTPCAGPTNLQSIHLVGLDSQYSTTDRRRLAIRTTAQLSTPSRPHHTVLSLCQRRQAS